MVSLEFNGLGIDEIGKWFSRRGCPEVCRYGFTDIRLEGGQTWCLGIATRKLDDFAN